MNYVSATAIAVIALGHTAAAQVAELTPEFEVSGLQVGNVYSTRDLDRFDTANENDESVWTNYAGWSADWGRHHQRGRYFYVDFRSGSVGAEDIGSLSAGARVYQDVHPDLYRFAQRSMRASNFIDRTDLENSETWQNFKNSYGGELEADRAEWVACRSAGNLQGCQIVGITANELARETVAMMIVLPNGTVINGRVEHRFNRDVPLPTEDELIGHYMRQNPGGTLGRDTRNGDPYSSYENSRIWLNVQSSSVWVGGYLYHDGPTGAAIISSFLEPYTAAANAWNDNLIAAAEAEQAEYEANERGGTLSSFN